MASKYDLEPLTWLESGGFEIRISECKYINGVFITTNSKEVYSTLTLELHNEVRSVQFRDRLVPSTLVQYKERPAFLIEIVPEEDTEESYQDAIKTVFSNYGDEVGVILDVCPPYTQDDEMREMNVDLMKIFRHMTADSGEEIDVSYEPRKTWTRGGRKLFSRRVETMNIDLHSDRIVDNFDSYSIKPNFMNSVEIKHRSSVRPAVRLWIVKGTRLFSQVVNFLDLNT